MDMPQINFQPKACRPEAYAYVRSRLTDLNSTTGLLHCALGVSMHALDDLEPSQLDRELDRLACCVRKQCRSSHPTALLAHLHDVLFDQEQFCGASEERYFNPINSYLSAVVTSKHGIPITLSLIYKAVAERLGLIVEGVLSRGHFLVRVWDGRGWLIIDPCRSGRVLTVAEACQLIGSLMGERLESDKRHLPVATHRQWLTRILVNLCHIFQTMRNQHDLRAMHELLLLVHQSSS
jgi:regulator of sirC expression with transglutaminase-like and TPR domain